MILIYYIYMFDRFCQICVLTKGGYLRADFFLHWIQLGSQLASLLATRQVPSYLASSVFGCHTMSKVNKRCVFLWFASIQNIKRQFCRYRRSRNFNIFLMNFTGSLIVNMSIIIAYTIFPVYNLVLEIFSDVHISTCANYFQNVFQPYS